MDLFILDILLISLKSLPITNSWLRICIAATTAFLIGNSPDFETIDRKNLFGFSDHSDGVFTTLPANKRPQVEAFTNKLSALFKCSIHLPSDNLSEIIKSLVLLSGILRIDSARHIRATPSWLSSPYSLKKASNLVLSFLFSLHASIIFFALIEIEGSFKNSVSFISLGTIIASEINLLLNSDIWIF